MAEKGTTLRQLFKDALIRAGISQRAAAYRADISETRWRQVVMAGNPPQRLAQLAKIAGVGVAELRALGHDQAADRLASGDYPPIRDDFRVSAPTHASDESSTMVVDALSRASRAVEEGALVTALAPIIRMLRRAQETDNVRDTEVLLQGSITALQYLTQHFTQSTFADEKTYLWPAGTSAAPSQVTQRASEILTLLAVELNENDLAKVVNLAAREGVIQPPPELAAALTGEESQATDDDHVS